MERKYYPINESIARSAHNMTYTSNYKEGSKTKEYRGYVDRAYDAADLVADKNPDQAEKAYQMAERFAKKMADNINHDSAIGTRCPSVLISGPANFPTRKKEKQVAAWDKNMKEFNDIMHIIEKIKHLASSSAVIKSDDENALDKLQAKLDKLKELQEQMKTANKFIRMKDTAKGDEGLKGMGYTEHEIKKLREPDFCGRVGYPDYALQNNNANIHRIEGRIRQISKEKEAGTSEIQTDLFKVVENTELMRIQLIFDGKPEPEVRNVLKSNGFKWAPSQSAWQRQLNSNGRYAVERVIKELKGA